MIRATSDTIAIASDDRPMRPHCSLTLAAWVLFAPASARAAGTEAEACAQSAERAQALRTRGKLLESMVELRSCVRTSCPAFVRRDCAQWQTDVEASLPTVVVVAYGADGRDLVSVRVTVDGAPFAERLDGLATPLDPGEHRFRFETAGSVAVEQMVVVREGEKRRAVDVTFPTPPGRPPPRRSQPVEPATRGTWPWVFAGLGLAATGAGAVLAVSGLSDYHALAGGCGRTGACTLSEVNPLRTRLWTADALLVGGGVSLGVAGWLALRPLPGGAAVQVGGTL